MVANVYKIFYNPNYLLIFFYFVGLFFLSPLATHSTKLLFGPRFCVCFCYLSWLAFVFVLAGFGLPWRLLPRHSRYKLDTLCRLLTFGGFWGNFWIIGGKVVNLHFINRQSSVI